MSKPEIKTPEIKPEEAPKAEEKLSVVDINMVLVIAERDEAVEKLSIATEKIEKLNSHVANLEALIEKDSRASIIKDIAHKTSTPATVLSLMPIEKLLMYQKVLDTATFQTIRSGTAISKLGETSEREKLLSQHDEYMADKYGGNK